MSNQHRRIEAICETCGQPFPQSKTRQEAPYPKRISAKQRKLMRGVIAGKTITQSALDAGYSRKSAHVQGSRELKKVRAAMPEMLDRAGLGLGQMAQEIKRGIDKGDIGSHDKYLKLALQCHGALGAEDGDNRQTIDIGVFILKGLKERGLEHLLDETISGGVEPSATLKAAADPGSITAEWKPR